MLPKVCRMNHKNFVFALLKTIQKQAGKISTYFSKPNQNLPSLFLDSFQEREHEIFMIHPTHFW